MWLDWKWYETKSTKILLECLEVISAKITPMKVHHCMHSTHTHTLTVWREMKSTVVQSTFNMRARVCIAFVSLWTSCKCFIDTSWNLYEWSDGHLAYPLVCNTYTHSSMFPFFLSLQRCFDILGTCIRYTYYRWEFFRAHTTSTFPNILCQDYICICKLHALPPCSPRARSLCAFDGVHLYIANLSLLHTITWG